MSKIPNFATVPFTENRDKASLQQWRDDAEHIALKPIDDLTLADRGRHRRQTALHGRRPCWLRTSRHLSRLRAIRSRPICIDVCDAALDCAPICRLLDRRGL